MKLNQLRLNHFAQHEEKTVDFPSSGVVILQGANGSGKSNIVRALQFALRGTIPDLPSKGLAITWGSDTGSVELDFTINGLDCSITRSLSSAKATLTIGDDEFTSASEVNLELHKLLAISSSLISQIVFVNQGELTQVIRQAPAERAKFLHSICGTDRFEKIYNTIGLSLNKLLYVEKPVESTAQITESIQNLTDEIADKRQQIQTLEALIRDYDGEAKANYHAMMINYSSQVNNPTTGLEATIKLMGLYAGEVKALKARVNEAVAKYEQLKDLERIQTPIADKARLDLAQYTQSQKVQEDRAGILQALDELKAENEKWVNVKSDFVPNEEHYQGINSAIYQLDTFVARAENDLKKFACDECPTCGTTKIVPKLGDPVTFEELRRKSQERIDKSKDESRLYKIEITEYLRKKKIHEDTMREVNEWRTMYDASVAVLNGKLQSLETLAPDKTVDLAAARNIVDDMDKLRHEIAVADKEKSTVLSNCTNAEAKYQRTMDLHLKLLGLHGELVGYDFKAVENQLAAWNQQRNTLAQLRGEVMQLERNLTKLRDQWARVKAAEEKTEKQLKVRKLLETVRDVFHRDKLPAAITRTYFASINHVWNELLATLEVPFSCQFSDNFEVLLAFPNGNAMIQQASGGQQCCAALTFVLAVSRLFASQIGFIVLDEPTYGLDSDRIDRVTNLLQNLQSYATNNSLQIICVTHEERLKSGFEHIITL